MFANFFALQFRRFHRIRVEGLSVFFVAVYSSDSLRGGPNGNVITRLVKMKLFFCLIWLAGWLNYSGVVSGLRCSETVS